MRITRIMKNINQKLNRGFTLIELVIASSLFMIVALIASGAFVESLKNQRDVRDLTSANNNASQALEAMAREIRTGQDFVSSTASELNFKNYRSQQVSYKLLSDFTIAKCEEPVSCAGATATYTPITSKKYKVSALNFYYQGIQDGDSLPPRITISITIEGVRNQSVTLQTTVSSKNLGS